MWITENPVLQNISTHAPRTGSDQSRVKALRFVRISTHAPRTGSDSDYPALHGVSGHFNPRSPHGERPEKPPAAHQPPEISTHAPRTGSDLTRGGDERGGGMAFQPTLPARGATYLRGSPALPAPISTHAPRTGSDDVRVAGNEQIVTISTHAPRTGSDTTTPEERALDSNFNPRSPHGERRAALVPCAVCQAFQPTLPARGATRPAVVLMLGCVFQPTLPARGATLSAASATCTDAISTHAPRTGSDKCATPAPPVCIYFNPRSPHGERPSSHRSCWKRRRDFNPRSPHGERRAKCP